MRKHPPMLALAAILLAAAAPAPARPALPPAPKPRAARFHLEISPLGPQLRKRMTGESWHPGCPVGLGALRVLTVTHWGFDKRVRTGRLVVNSSAARRVGHALRSLYRHRYPIRRMRLVDAYGADDHRSMNADNTSAFNCRFVNGTSTWSQHAYGLAIDINPIENPYVSGGFISPSAGVPFATRPHRPGVIAARGPIVGAFANIGWEWLGRAGATRDYQHFSENGH